MKPVDELVKAFGGIRAFQRKLGERHASLIQGWQDSGKVPHYRKPQILASAEQHGVELKPELIAALFPDREAEAA